MKRKITRSSIADKVAEYYTARAPQYDTTAGYTDPTAECLRIPIKERYKKVFASYEVLEIACGTGYWTKVIAETANSVLATDISPEMIEIARERLSGIQNVKFLMTDAYSLDGVPEGFTAAFAIWWWSHIPKSCLPGFLSVLHSKLQSGAFVLFVDQIPSAYEAKGRHKNEAGDFVEERTLPDRKKYEIVKNFPTEKEAFDLLKDSAKDIVYREYLEEHAWNLNYTII